MRTEGEEWLRCHGIGRERMVRYLAEYLQGLGFSSEELFLQGTGKGTSELTLKLIRPNPSVPRSLTSLRLLVVATGSGCEVYWDFPDMLDGDEGMEKPRRFATEMVAHLVRTVSTLSRGAAKVMEAHKDALPFVVGQSGEH